jgi:hypothetical protein
MDTDGSFHNTESLAIRAGPYSPNQCAIGEYVVVSRRQIVMGARRPVHCNRLAARPSCSGERHG